jgi:hypothetical protein
MKEKMLFNLPPDILGHVYSFDTTYKDYIQQIVLVEMMAVVQERLFNVIKNMGNDYNKLFEFLVSDSVNPRLIAYDPTFHALDRKFFNYYFMRRLWNDSL